VALTLEDVHGPDGGPFTLWILFNIPAARSSIPEGLSKTAYPSQVPGAEQGANDTGEIGYDGPPRRAAIPATGTSSRSMR